MSQLTYITSLAMPLSDHLLFLWAPWLQHRQKGDHLLPHCCYLSSHSTTSQLRNPMVPASKSWLKLWAAPCTSKDASVLPAFRLLSCSTSSTNPPSWQIPTVQLLMPRCCFRNLRRQHAPDQLAIANGTQLHTHQCTNDAQVNFDVIVGAAAVCASRTAQGVE